MAPPTPSAALAALLSALPPAPLDPAELDTRVARALADVDGAGPARAAELRRARWELALKADVFALAEEEGAALRDPATRYYDDMRRKLDVALAFQQHEATEPSFLLTLLEDLLQSQGIASCARIFSWVEARARALTAGMTGTKGMSLVLLRTLNGLLRRLSKGGPDSVFSGRILALLSAVFPLGERSGVNLRGEYGPQWEDVGAGVGVKKEEDAMDVDGATEQAKRDAFYKTFWSLQLPFSRPPVFAATLSVADFKAAVEAVLPRLAEATARERALAGSRAGQERAEAARPQKRKRADGEDASTDYFFAKFLTSPELLDLEIADTHFRRQIIFQLLVLLQHLGAWTATAKAAWQSPKNRSLQMDFTLAPADAEWVTATRVRLVSELRASAPRGQAFADAAAAVLGRERNWVRWKNDGCPPFERAVRVPGVEEETRDARKRMRAESDKGAREEDVPRYGSATLRGVWEDGYSDLGQLEVMMRKEDDIAVYATTIKREDKVAAGLRAKATPAPAADAPADAPPPAPKLDRRTAARLESLEANRLKQGWLAMRAARGAHYAALAAAGTGDVVALEAALADAAAKEKEREREDGDAEMKEDEKEGAEKVEATAEVAPMETG